MPTTSPPRNNRSSCSTTAPACKDIFTSTGPTRFFSPKPLSFLDRFSASNENFPMLGLLIFFEILGSRSPPTSVFFPPSGSGSIRRFEKMDPNPANMPSLLSLGFCTWRNLPSQLDRSVTAGFFIPTLSRTPRDRFNPSTADSVFPFRHKQNARFGPMPASPWTTKAPTSTPWRNTAYPRSGCGESSGVS